MTRRRSSSWRHTSRQLSAFSSLFSGWARSVRNEINQGMATEAHYWRIRSFAAKEETERLRQAELANKLVLQDIKIEAARRALGETFMETPEAITLAAGMDLFSTSTRGVFRVVETDPARTVLEWNGQLYTYLTSYVLGEIRNGRAKIVS